MQNKKTLLLFTTILFSNALVAFPALADNATTSTSTINSISTSTPASIVSGVQVPTIPVLITQTQQAKAALGNISLNHVVTPIYKNIKNKKTGKTTKTLSSYVLSSKDIALAILDPVTNTVITTVGKQNGKTMSFSDSNATLKLTNFNGVNSKFQITVPAGGTVLALKYLISGADSGSKAAIENNLSEAVYVPYSSGLNDPQVLQYGANYLDGIIKNVASSLQTLPSQAIPGKTVTEAIPPAMIKALVYAEHTDTTQVLKGNIQDTINQLNILFATNQGDAYKYSVSTAAARGIAQFIPSTYASLVQRHPEAGLISDFVTGMADHYNSIKAMYLLLDDYAGAVRVKAAQGFASGRIFEYAAASYNGGTTRVAKAVNAFGSDWNADRSGEVNTLQSQIASLPSQIKKAKDKKIKSSLQNQLASAKDQLATLQAATLRNETINYLNKIYKVISVFNDQLTYQPPHPTAL
jgi:hypothetical protein